MYKLAPSLLAADFAMLGDNLRTVTRAGAHYIHFDVMDGLFVPNISFGVPVLQGVRAQTPLLFDVHLMIVDPIRYVPAFAKAGADLINFHLEATQQVDDCIRAIRAHNKKAAITIKPDTPVAQVLPYAEQVDMLLIMSVEPGFGGQRFMQESLHKAEALADFIQNHGLETEIEMDGGIDLHNVRSVLDAGVNVVVAGSAVFAPTHAETENAIRQFLAVFAER